MLKNIKILFICSLIIYISCADDPCASHTKTDCASDTTNNCKWTKTKDASCTNKCSTYTTSATCTSPCTWSQTKAASCSKKPFTCANLNADACKNKETHADEFCEWDETEEECGDNEELNCSNNDESACTTAANTCTWTAAQGTCSLSGTDACTSKAQAQCTESCVWAEETGKCAKETPDSSGGNPSETDSSEFLKISVFICLFIFFL